MRYTVSPEHLAANRILTMSKPKEQCHACGQRVTGELREGYRSNGTQVMAIFDCPNCGAGWKYDVDRRKYK